MLILSSFTLLYNTKLVSHNSLMGIDKFFLNIYVVRSLVTIIIEVVIERVSVEMANTITYKLRLTFV